MKRLAYGTGVLAALAWTLFPQDAAAVAPHLPDLVAQGNRWTITFYDDTSPGHAQWATQGICFYYAGVMGTHQQYIWISDTYPDWNGRASQEGDQVFMHGDFQWPFGDKDGGHDGMQWELVTVSPRDIGAGHWHEWAENGAFGITFGFGNTMLRRVGKCQAATTADAFAASPFLPLPDTSVDNPMGVPRAVYEQQNKAQ
jgi:hypothetical protein